MKRIAFIKNWYCNGTPVTLPHDAQITEKRSKEASDGGHKYGYTGSGIYRPVWLYVGDEKRIEYRGVKITTVSVSPAVVRAGQNTKITVTDGSETTTAEISVKK